MSFSLDDIEICKDCDRIWDWSQLDTDTDGYKICPKCGCTICDPEPIPLNENEYVCNECDKTTFAQEEPIRCGNCDADNFGIIPYEDRIEDKQQEDILNGN